MTKSAIMNPIIEQKRHTYPQDDNRKQKSFSFKTLTFSTSSTRSWNSLKRIKEKLGSSQTLRQSTEHQDTCTTVKISDNIPELAFRIWLRIFSYLDANSLAICSGICKSLQTVAMNADLWQMHCFVENVNCGPGIEHIWERCDGNRGKWWKEIYIDGVVGRKNWIHGNHKKRLISVTDPTDAITCFKCDVDKIIIGTRNRNLSLYNTQSTEVWDKPAIKPEMMFLEVHHSPILCIDYQTPVGHLLTSADALGTLGIWNLYTGELLALHKKAHDKGISCVSIIDSNYIISAGFDKVVRLFKVDEQLAKPAELFQADSKHSISSSNQSKRFSKPSFFKRLFKKNKSPKHHLKCKLTLKKEFRGHKGEIYCMRVLSTRTHFATGATDFQIKIWNIKTVECEKTLRGHTNTITCLTSKGDLLYSGSLDCAIRCWSTSTGQCLSVFVGHSEWVKSIAISGKLLVSGGWDESVLLWNRENSTLVKKIRLDMGPISNIQCSETKVILACREEGFQHQLTILDFGRNSVGFWGDHKTL